MVDSPQSIVSKWLNLVFVVMYPLKAIKANIFPLMKNSISFPVFREGAAGGRVKQP